MTLSPLSKALLTLMVLALAMIAGLNTYTFFHFWQAPLAITAARVVNSPVPFGDEALFQYTSERWALCKTDADIFVLKIPEQLLMLVERRPAGMFPLGASSGYVRIPTLHMKPGKYVARFFVHSDCGDRTHTFMVPDIPFEVEE
jgi:hypothetical protein